MAGTVLNIKVYSPLKLHSGLTGNYHAICHYSYNLPFRAQCTNNKGGRMIERSEHTELIETNKKRIEENKNYYR
ncbi:MAG: hypothetical protein Q8J88_02455 [Bacteroidales bacterium]|nr:hypothetical protein [Bacteroidales bacterium]